MIQRLWRGAVEAVCHVAGTSVLGFAFVKLVSMEQRLGALALAAGGLAVHTVAIEWLRARLDCVGGPPHLRGRVPVECGEGIKTSTEYGCDGVGIAAPKWTPPPDEAGRAFLRSVPALKAQPREEPRITPAAVGWREHLREGRARVFASAPMPPYKVALDSARTKAERASEAGMDVAWVTSDEWRAVYFTVSMRFDANPLPAGVDRVLVLNTPRGTVRLEIEPTPEEMERGRCKPPPAENARRYSEEDGTW